MGIGPAAEEPDKISERIPAHGKGADADCDGIDGRKWQDEDGHGDQTAVTEYPTRISRSAQSGLLGAEPSGVIPGEAIGQRPRAENPVLRDARPHGEAPGLVLRDARFARSSG